VPLPVLVPVLGHALTLGYHRRMADVWQWLAKAGAQADAVDWARPYGGDFRRLWSECPRGDWLLAIAARLGCERVVLLGAAAACARLALPHLPENETRPAEALDALEAFCAGEVDAAACQAHRAAVDAAVGEAPDPIVGAAASAVLAALDAFTEPDSAAATVAFASQAAVLDAADCAMESALRYTQAESADRVRASLSADVAAVAYAAAAG